MNKIKNFTFNFSVLILLLFSVMTTTGYCQENLFPITLTDDSGIKITLNEKPRRIISAAPSNTEIIFALGLENKLVGRSEFCNYPQNAEKIESIGKMSPLNLEKIASLEPDLILSYGGFQLKDIPRLRELGFKVLVIQSESLQDMIQGIQLIATACGIPEKGTQLTTEMKKRIFRVTSHIDVLPVDQRPKVFVGSSYNTIYSPGSETLFHELITLAGGQNIVRHLQGWVKINPEMVAQSEPDIMLIPSGIMNPEEISKIKQDIRNHPGWSHVPAIRQNRIYAVNEDLFYRAGPRLVDGLELLYELFTQSKSKES